MKPSFHGGRRRGWQLWLLWLYPAAWRQRYREELTALLGAHPDGVRTVLSLIVGAADAHLHPRLVPRAAAGTWRRSPAGAIALLGAIGVLALAEVALQQVRDPVSGWQALVGGHPAARLLLSASQATAALAVLFGLASCVGVVAAVLVGCAATGMSVSLGVTIGCVLLLGRLNSELLPVGWSVAITTMMVAAVIVTWVAHGHICPSRAVGEPAAD